MLKSILFCIAFALLPVISSAQNNGTVQWAWSNTYGNGNDNSIANHLVLDDDENMYIAGVFRGELVVQTDTIWGNPLEDRVFVAKFDSLGTLKWIRRIDWGYFVNQIQLDSDNDLRVLCNSGTMIVYNGMNGVPIIYYPVPNSISDYNSTTPFGAAIDFKMDANDNMYVLSRFEDMNTWENSSYMAVYASPNDTISSTLWEDHINTGFFFSSGPSGFGLDSNNNVYVTGTTDYASLSLVGTDVVSTPVGNQLFAVKYNTVGEVQWLSVEDMNFLNIQGAEVNTIDSSFYITGFTYADGVLYGDTLLLDTTNQQQIFLLKYNLDGATEWSKSFPLATKTLKDYPQASWGATGSHVQISDSGYVYLKGSFTGSIIFQNDTLIEDTSSVVLNVLADDVFIAKLDPNGNPIWGKYGGNMGGIGLETGDFYVNPATDILYLVGYWFSPNNLFKWSNPTDGVKNFFIGKEGVPSTVSMDEISSDGITLFVYPNPSTGEFIVSKPPNSQSSTYQILNTQGEVILSGVLDENIKSIDLTNYASGMYFLRTELGSTKLLKQ